MKNFFDKLKSLFKSESSTESLPVTIPQTPPPPIAPSQQDTTSPSGIPPTSISTPLNNTEIPPVSISAPLNTEISSTPVSLPLNNTEIPSASISAPLNTEISSTPVSLPLSNTEIPSVSINAPLDTEISSTPVSLPLNLETPSITPNTLESVLSPIISTLSSFPELTAIATHLGQFTTYTQLDTQQFNAILAQIDQIVTLQTTKLTELEHQLTQATTASHPLASFYELTQKSAHSTFTETPLTHEDFLGHTNLSSLVNILVFGQELLSHAPSLNLSEQNLTQVKELVQVGQTLLDKVAAVSPAIEQFKSKEESLRNDILAFTDVITKLQSQPGLSADWNGKKDVLTAKKQELDTRRESFVQDEEKINQALAVVTQNIPLILKQLTSLATSLLPILESTIAQTPASSTSSASTVSQATHCKQILQVATTTKNQLVTSIPHI